MEKYLFLRIISSNDSRTRCTEYIEALFSEKGICRAHHELLLFGGTRANTFELSRRTVLAATLRTLIASSYVGGKSFKFGAVGMIVSDRTCC